MKFTDLQKAIAVTKNLLNYGPIQQHDSLLNVAKFFHSRHLMIADENLKSQKIIHEIFPYFRKLEDNRWVILLIRMGHIKMRLGEYEQAIEYLNKAIPECQSYQMSINRGLAYLHLSDINRLQSNLGEAYRYGDLSLRAFQQKNRVEWVSTALGNLGYICTLVKDYECAQQQFDTLFNLIDQIKDQSFLMHPYLYSGIMHFDQGNLNLAEELFHKGLDQIATFKKFADIPLIYYYLGKVSKTKEAYSQAEEYAQESIKSAISSKNQRQLKRSQILLADIQTQTKPNRDNIQLLDTIYKWALVNKDNVLLKESSNLIASYYFNKGDYQKGLTYKEIYAEATEEKWSQDISNSISLMKERNRFEQESIKKDLEKERLAVRLKANRQGQNIMILFTVLLLAMSGLLLYYYNQKNISNKFLKIRNQELRKAESMLATKNEELKQYINSNIQLEQFAHVASHDLRAPIITINSFSKLLHQKANTKLNEAEKQYLGFISSNSTQMLELINDLLEYSKINSQTLHLQKVDMQELTKSVLNVLKHEASVQEIEINFKSHLPIIVADPVKIKRVLQNLISNAIKFSDISKTSKVDLYHDSSKGYWEFYVADNGIGMPQTDIDIFKPYKQLNNKSKYKGTGLGLSFCKKIVLQHQGEIDYRSKEKEGSIFRFTISKQLTPKEEDQSNYEKHMVN